MVGLNTLGQADLTVPPADVVKLKDVESLFSAAVGPYSVTLLFALDI